MRERKKSKREGKGGEKEERGEESVKDVPSKITQL